MMACNLRSLLVAAIVLSNCITWTASRHHFRHNAFGHRSRHRRNGAGLYHPASFVIPGGDGYGWGDWGEVSPCSRTCGGGVASQKRICLATGPEGAQCSGGDTKYFSCNTQDCPEGSIDFRAQQCSEFDDKDFRGYRFTWLPYTKTHNPCELNCQPRGERFYYRHKAKVVDGTRCNDDSLDVCVNGQCQSVGCDMMLGSNAREDKCRECRGNGSSCHTISDIFDSQDLVTGYNDILLIPAGSTFIEIEEIAPSINYLALRGENNTYYLNGHYTIDFPRRMLIAGAQWHYERSPQSFAAPDRLYCVGPTNESLYLSLLFRNQNVGIRYEYSVPNTTAPPPDKHYHWVFEKFTECSATCGGGFQTRNVTCRSTDDNELVYNALCDEGQKLETNQSCNTDPCPPRWVEGPWTNCSKRCGEGGVKSREVTCQKIIANGYSSTVNESECFELLGPKPELFQKCNEDVPCPKWFIGRWKPCNKLCDDGIQTRQVVCRHKTDKNVEILDDKECGEKPEDQKPCFVKPCEGVDWVTTDWLGCDSCISTNRTRQVLCVTKSMRVLNDSFCEHHVKPAAYEPCKKEDMPVCETMWYASKWSKCSVECGEGVQKRKVFCGLYDGKSVTEVEDSKCAGQTKYNDTKPCVVPKEQCPAQWYAGPWEACTKLCGGGERFRRVKCLKGDQEANSKDCDQNSVLDSTEECNKHPCDTSTPRPVYCDELESVSDFTEVGLDSVSDPDAEEYIEVGLAVSEPERGDMGSVYSSDMESFLPVSSVSGDDLITDGSGDTTTDDPDTVTMSDIDDISTEPTEIVSSTSINDTSTAIPPDGGITSTNIDASGMKTTPDGGDVTAASSGGDRTKTTPDGGDVTLGSSNDNSTNATPDDDRTTQSSTGDYSTITSSDEDDTTESSTDDYSTDITLDEDDTTDSSIDDYSTNSSPVSDDDTTSNTSDGPKKTTPDGGDVTDTIMGKDSTKTTPDGGDLTVANTEATPDGSDVSSSDVTAITGNAATTDDTATSPSGETEATSSTEVKETETSSTGETVTTSSVDTMETSSTGQTEETNTDSNETGTTPSGDTETTSSGETEITSSAETETTSSGETETTSSGETETTSSGETETTTSGETRTTSSGDTETASTGETETTSSGDTETTSSGDTETTSSGGTETTSSGETGTTSSGDTETTSSGETAITSSVETGTTSPVGETMTTSSIDTKETATTSDALTVTTSSVDTEETGTTLVEETETISSLNSYETTGSASGETVTTSSMDSEETSPAGETITTSSIDSKETATTLAGETATVSTITVDVTPTSSASETTTTSYDSETAITSTGESVTTGSVDTDAKTTASAEATETSRSTNVEETVTKLTGESETTGFLEETATSARDVLTSSSTDANDYSATPAGEIDTSVTGAKSSIDEESITTEATSTVQAETEITTTGETSTGVPEGTGVTDNSPWWSSTPLMCIARPTCRESPFNCCPDGKTPASGPFDEGCPKAETCEESQYGCCSDGVSAAEGPDDEGCPEAAPCDETLYGCCLDNKTAASGNDFAGCPPLCMSSEYGCCSDNETAAIGPRREGCNETETTVASSTDSTESTTDNEITEGSQTDITSTISSGTGATDIIESEVTSDQIDTETTSEGSVSKETSTDTSESVQTTVQEGCSFTEFGCCYDNETAAPDANGQGCPCNTTQFGCCPDGESPAQGPGDEGCLGDCRNTQYGCCNDNETPAHGPNQEGCCLLSSFGCCPDNRKPAEGPHLEGCTCENSLYGCCPDGVTAAHGPDNIGCGCQYTEFGCCPNRHDEARGPNYEGCPCYTYQFGCCPDGVTVAGGPNQQGCHCRDSPYGCCSDGETPAAGSNGTGCDCASSKYGCCPDGTTEATGPKFLGCADRPENRQAACSLPTDPGPCFNFSAYWFYDTAYGGCTRFWYGGCEGNGNKFATKEECEDVCVQPAPKDACKLPGVKGPCGADSIRWYYNTTMEQCTPFRYGGCLGNANNFESRELCQAQCEPATTTDQCSQPIEEGSCAGTYSRWGYNQETGRCDQFIWGGCEGNSNRFKTEAACQMRCSPPGVLAPQCTQPQEAGNCTKKEALWSFSQSENRCVPFHYTGCGGNDNRFENLQSCEQTCPSAYEPEKCTLPAAPGDCGDYRLQWFYDTSAKTCRQFYYGGCGGNGNNFASEAECHNVCSERELTTTISTPALTTSSTPSTLPTTLTTEAPKPVADRCSLKSEVGDCDKYTLVWYYDQDAKSCRQFYYGGCGGNENRFATEEECSRSCPEQQALTTTQRTEPPPVIEGDRCAQKAETGTCYNYTLLWYYDVEASGCRQFYYGGCDGNENRFATREECSGACEVPKPHDTAKDRCNQEQAIGPCDNYTISWYYNQASRSCDQFYYGGCEGNENRFATEAECIDVCNKQTTTVRPTLSMTTVPVFTPEVPDQDCFRELDVGPCHNYKESWGYDSALGKCTTFQYGGCGGNRNNFPSEEYCQFYCHPVQDICQLPMMTGPCQESQMRWFYDANSDSCSQFTYGGCEGNDNRFESLEACEARCRSSQPPVTTPATSNTAAIAVVAEACSTPASLEPCGERLTAFYYDSERRQCLPSEIGGCGHPNTYRSEEECERQCGAFRGLDICNARLDPGRCRNGVNKYYWNAAWGRCENFTYGGCEGGPNRFSSAQECQEFCGHLAPAPACLQPLSTGRACEAPQRQRWHYSPDAVACVVFAYQGCGGNDNNFLSYQQCTRDCRVPEDKLDPNQNEVIPGPDCRLYDEECAQLQCGVSGVQRSYTSEGCTRCSCVEPPADCTPQLQECQALVCPFGIRKLLESNGCERCDCYDDPCEATPCSATERCVAVPYREPATQEPRYSARCEPVAPNCEQYNRECVRLRCEFGKQRTPTGDGCERCSCVPLEVDCSPLRSECEELKCTYGIDRTMGDDGCPRCRCAERPCSRHSCAAGERCVDVSNKDPITMTIRYDAECRTVLKPGMCPAEAGEPDDECRNDCSDDADCRGVGKCCWAGCSRVCAMPAPPTAAATTRLTSTHAPEIPRAPEVDPQTENQVAMSEGGKATLRCLFHGNPPPKITWRRGELTIDGNQGRYRLLSDGALEIVSLYRTDAGVYICVADNGLGIATQEVHLAVNVPVNTHIQPPTGPLTVGQELRLPCEVDGFPDPEVYWSKDGKRIYPDGQRITITGSSSVSRLTVAQLTTDDSGLYECHASNEYSSDTATAQITITQGIQVPAKCTDNPFFANCNLIVRNNFCRHKYYSKFCCKSCLEAGQIDAEEAELQADQPYKRK